MANSHVMKPNTIVRENHEIVLPCIQLPYRILPTRAGRARADRREPEQSFCLSQIRSGHFIDFGCLLCLSQPQQ